MVQNEQGTKVDRLVSIDIAERFEALQDEVDLLKVEVKQTLVDLREFIMKGKSVFPTRPPAPALREVPPIRDAATLEPEPEPMIETATPEPVPYTAPIAEMPKTEKPMVEELRSSALVEAEPVPTQANNAMDSAMMARIVSWLGTIKGRGISLQQLTPYLEAYESSGYLSPLMVKVVIRSVADLDQATKDDESMRFSPQNYAECIGEFHEIVCGAPDVEPEAETRADNLVWLERC